MSKKLTFSEIEIKKSAFHKSKYPIDINEVDIKNILISDNVLYGKKVFKYCIHYKCDHKVKPLCIMLPKMSGYVICFHETKYISLFFIKDEELLEVFKTG